MMDEEHGGLTVEPITTQPDWYEQFNIALAFRVGPMIFVSGQVAIDDDGNVVGSGDFDRQAEQAFSNLKRVLEAGGSSIKDVVKVTIYLTDMVHFSKIVGLRAQHFVKPYPADTIVEVSALALPDLMIEIEAVAVQSRARRESS